MNKDEIYRELLMSYNDLQTYLVKKYGAALYDYYLTPELKSRNKKVSRTKEGLFCHHMDEDKADNLVSPANPKWQNFEWQKKERLVYCNIIEHLILHIKIAILRWKKPFKEPEDIHRFFRTNGCLVISSEINDMYMQNGTSLAWKKRCFEIIEDNYEDYISINSALLFFISKLYTGKKDNSRLLIPGGIYHFNDCDAMIVEILDDEDKVLLKCSDGKEYKILTALLSPQFTYCDWMSIYREFLSNGNRDFYEKIYTDLKNYSDKSVLEKYSSAFFVDYK